MNVGALLWILRGKLGRIDGGRLVQTILRTGLAAAIAAAVMVVLGAGIPAVLVVGGLTGQLLQVGLAATGGFGVYLLACWLFRVQELGIALSLFGRSRPAASVR